MLLVAKSHAVTWLNNCTRQQDKPMAGPITWPLFEYWYYSPCFHIGAPSCLCCCLTLSEWDCYHIDRYYCNQLRRLTCPRYWSHFRCVKDRARVAVSGEDARPQPSIRSLHRSVWPPLLSRQGWALCRLTSGCTRPEETWRLPQSEGGKSRILERPSLQVHLAENLICFPAPSRLFLCAHLNLNLSPIDAIHAELGQNALSQQWCYSSCMM